MLAVAVLMRDPGDAKTRLRSVLDDAAREHLARSLFENTLRFFNGYEPAGLLAVVTPSPVIERLALSVGAEVLIDDGADGINGAASIAAAWALERGADRLLLMHADIPSLARNELDSLLAASLAHAVVIGASSDGGTNALLVSPPDAIPFRFGPGSAGKHEAAACQAGLSCAKLLLDNLSHDVDTPEDLARTQRPDIRLFAVPGIPEIAEGDDIGAIILAAIERNAERIEPGDVVAVAQKIVSKSEGRLRALDDYVPSAEALKIAGEIGKDARKVEAILQESQGVMRMRRQAPEGLLITRHRLGWICANAGIDQSNLGDGKEGMLLLLPEDPDASARRIRQSLEKAAMGPVGVVVTDTFGRPWRHGLVNVAIGVAGVPAVVDWNTRTDAYGRALNSTVPAFADEIAAATGLLMRKDGGLPVVVVRGLCWRVDEDSTANALLRQQEKELFL